MQDAKLTSYCTNSTLYYEHRLREYIMVGSEIREYVNIREGDVTIKYYLEANEKDASHRKSLFQYTVKYTANINYVCK